jgi:iron complex transport system substrate-binding protein
LTTGATITAMRTATTLTLLATLFAGLAHGAFAVEPPRRIVSINMCTDELLLALADPQQIFALSPYAADPAMSFMAEKATSYRHDVAAAESVVALHPDLVLASQFNDPGTLGMLERLGYRLELFDSANSIADSVAQIRKFAALVGHSERGTALIAKIDAARKTAIAAARGRTHPTAIVYQRRGYVTGGDTLTGELLSIAGFTNDGGTVAGRTGGFVPLEKLVTNRPDYIVVASPDPRAEDQGTALLSHPVLTTLYPQSRRIVLPERLTVCGGPSLPTALGLISQEAARVEHSR